MSPQIFTHIIGCNYHMFGVTKSMAAEPEITQGSISSIHTVGFCCSGWRRLPRLERNLGVLVVLRRGTLKSRCSAHSQRAACHERREGRNARCGWYGAMFSEWGASRLVTPTVLLAQVIDEDRHHTAAPWGAKQYEKYYLLSRRRIPTWSSPDDSARLRVE